MSIGCYEYRTIVKCSNDLAKVRVPQTGQRYICTINFLYLIKTNVLQETYKIGVY